MRPGGRLVYCIDADRGEGLWKTPVETGGGRAALTKKDVFVGSRDGYLYRLSIYSCEILEKYYLGGRVLSPVVANGHVLVVTDENILYCLGPSESFHTRMGVIAVVLAGILILFLSKKLKHK